MDLPSFQGETNSWRNKQHLSGPAVLNNNFLIGCFVCVASLPSNYVSPSYLPPPASAPRYENKTLPSAAMQAPFQSFPLLQDRACQLHRAR